jgi:hypothetical protein
MVTDVRAARPGVALRPIAKTGDLPCRRLSVHGPEPTDPDASLLHRYAPDLVNLPGMTDDAAPPYPNGQNDYQPSAVGVYLDGIRTVRQVPRGFFGWLNIAYTGCSYVLVILPVFMALVGIGADWLGPAAVVAVANTLVANLVLVPVFRLAGTPADRDELRDRCRRRDRALKLSMTVFPTYSFRRARDPLLAWQQYRTAAGLDAHPGGPPNKVVYGRVHEEESGLKVLQYWLFFYYNDWWNKHEADWEVVMVYLDAADQPLAVACSSHLSGTWRPWAAVEPTGSGEKHPMVFVARGSHALYFNVAGGTHYAVLRQPWAVFDFSGQLLVRGSKDAVGPPIQDPDQYRLEVIPRGAEKIEETEPAWPDWWWLQFAGRWGARDGVLSPAIQEDELRWARPVEWARDHCDADSSSWDEMVDAGLAATGGQP